MKLQNLSHALRFSGSWEIEGNILQNYGKRHTQQARQIFEKLTPEIQALPDSVKLSYDHNDFYGRRVRIKIKSPLVDSLIFQHVEPKREGFLWLKREPLEKFIQRAIGVAKQYAEEYEVK